MNWIYENPVQEVAMVKGLSLEMILYVVFDIFWLLLLLLLLL